MVDFYKDWYNNLIRHSNEKDLLVEKIDELLKGKAHEKCLEIGLGTSAYFAEKLSGLFEEYWIVEKEEFSGPLPNNVHLMESDFESASFDRKFDVILASHVVYYFGNLKSALEKIFFLLNAGGRVYFVVNGKESDYGPIKDAFAELVGKPYTFTYDSLKQELYGRPIREYTTQASLSFSSHDDLYEALRLSFDLFPLEYQEHKQEMVNWLSKNVHGDRFFIDQKILEVTK